MFEKDRLKNAVKKKYKDMFSEEGIDKNILYGLGCGNPNSIADLKPGETVVDLGCGAGFDLMLAARSVGEQGKLIGVDMTAEMIEKAKENAENNQLTNTEFYHADIENLPLDNNSVDVVMSNCAINLAPDKRKVYKEAFRVLKPGGRLAVADILKKKDFPGETEDELSNYTNFLTGAVKSEVLEDILKDLNYVDINIKAEENSAEIVSDLTDDDPLADWVFSAYITAKRPEIEFSFAELSRLKSSLSSQNAMRIIKFISAQEKLCTREEVMENVSNSQGEVEKQLKKLVESAWLIVEKQGDQFMYKLNQETIQRYKILSNLLFS
ncbi:MAG: methyltransferase domain-containing protein [Bacillota bacterium]